MFNEPAPVSSGATATARMMTSLKAAPKTMSSKAVHKPIALRSDDRRGEKNEIFVDVIDRISAVFNSSGQVRSSRDATHFRDTSVTLHRVCMLYVSPTYIRSFMPPCLCPLTCARIFSLSFTQITSRASSSYAMVADLTVTTSFAFSMIMCPTSSSFATAATTVGVCEVFADGAEHLRLVQLRTACTYGRCRPAGRACC